MPNIALSDVQSIAGVPDLVIERKDIIAKFLPASWDGFADGELR